MAVPRNHIKVFVSSTVYDFENQLHQVYALLDGMGYDVFMSKEGTVPVNSRLNTFVNCEKGVEECDVFVGFVRPLLGSGIYDKDVPSVTEREFDVAFRRGMVRFILADFKVEFAHQFLNLINKNPDFIPAAKRNEENINGVQTLVIKANKLVHPQCVELYRKAIQCNEKDFEKRIGNWVQPYKDVEDILRHLEAQFRDVQRVKDLLP